MPLSHVVDAEGYERRIQKLRNIIFEMDKKHAEEIQEKNTEIERLNKQIDDMRSRLTPEYD